LTPGAAAHVIGPSRNPTGDPPRDEIGGTLRRHVFPEPEDLPSEFAEPPIRVSIPRLISQELRVPVPPVHLRPRAVSGATVPEAPVDEHCRTVPRQDDVDLAGAPLEQRPM